MNVARTEVPKGWRIAWDAFGDAVSTHASCALKAQPFAAFADTQREAIARAKRWVMAGPAGDISVPRQYFVVK